MRIGGLRNLICERLCGHVPHKPITQMSVEPAVREASHKVANRSAEISGSVVRIRQELDAIEELALALRNEKKKVANGQHN